MLMLQKYSIKLEEHSESKGRIVIQSSKLQTNEMKLKMLGLTWLTPESTDASATAKSTL